jgi:hypothetical protein
MYDGIAISYSLLYSNKRPDLITGQHNPEARAPGTKNVLFG